MPLASLLAAIGPLGYLLGLSILSSAGMFLGYRRTGEGIFVRRGSYFAGLMFISVASTGLRTLADLLLLPLPTLWALAGGCLVTLVASFFVGYTTMQLTVARANDIWGSRRRALLIFIPFAIFWFWFRRSRGDATDQAGEILRPYVGRRGVGFGFGAVIALSVIQGVIAALTPPASLEDRLQFAAVLVHQPAELMLGVDIASVAAQGKVLTLTLRADAVAGGPMDEAARAGATAEICASGGVQALVLEGATVRLVFADGTGRVIDTVEASPASCRIGSP